MEMEAEFDPMAGIESQTQPTPTAIQQIIPTNQRQENEETRDFHIRVLFGDLYRTQPSQHNRDAHDDISDISDDCDNDDHERQDPNDGPTFCKLRHLPSLL